jgi:hypothetical protein
LRSVPRSTADQAVVARFGTTPSIPVVSTIVGVVFERLGRAGFPISWRPQPDLVGSDCGCGAARWLGSPDGEGGLAYPALPVLLPNRQERRLHGLFLPHHDGSLARITLDPELPAAPFTRRVARVSKLEIAATNELFAAWAPPSSVVALRRGDALGAVEEPDWDGLETKTVVERWARSASHIDPFVIGPSLLITWLRWPREKFRGLARL